MRTVAALYIRPDSIYKQMPQVEPYDAARDATSYDGPHPIVAHPPCRLWGRFRNLSTAPSSERELALIAVRQVRAWGGVLEHPRASSLWKAAGLPRPGSGRDNHGGHSLNIDQFWFGHRAQKPTWLYIVGIDPGQIPPFPIRLGSAPCLITNNSRFPKDHPNHRREVSKAEREHTPQQFAEWLLQVARLTTAPNP